MIERSHLTCVTAASDLCGEKCSRLLEMLSLRRAKWNQLRPSTSVVGVSFTKARVHPCHRRGNNVCPTRNAVGAYDKLQNSRALCCRKKARR